MPVPTVYVPLSAIFPDAKADFATFRELLGGLSRTDTIFWCARLGLILSNPHNTDERGKQQYCVRSFLGAAEIGQLNRFIKDYPVARVFFREQLLELIRWTTLFSEDHSNDGNAYADVDVRRRFARAALMAGDLWGQRVYRNGLPLSDDRVLDRRRAMPALREGVMVTAPEITRVLARGEAFYRGAFQSGYADTETEFLAATRLTLDEYMTCVRNVLVHYAHLNPETVSPQKWGGILISSLRESISPAMRDPFDRYIELESQTPDELRAALWSERETSDVSEADLFDDRPLRERPLLRTPDGRAIIMDHAFYAEKAAVGPLFALVRALDRQGKRGPINKVFEAFGNAFERYINDLLRSMYPTSAVLPDRLVCNPHAQTANGDDVEIADACLNDVHKVVLFESKGVFVPDEAVHDAETYLVALRKKFGEHGGRKRGAAQLGRWLGEIATRETRPTGQDWSQVELVYPVLVVYDVRIDRPGHAEFLVEEFMKALAPDELLRNGYACKGSLRFAPLSTMTIYDLESLESSVDHFPLIDLLGAYAQSGHNGIRESLHDFLAYKKYPISTVKLATRAEALLMEAHEKMFPHIPIPTAPPESKRHA